MPVAPTYPGVYIQEIPSGVRALTGAPTAVAGFVDRFDRGPAEVPVRVSSWGQVERIFGGLSEISPAAYALNQFFANGGGVAWIVRVAPGAAAATTIARTGTVGGSGNALTISAANPGPWGNLVRAAITPRTATTYDLSVRRYTVVDDREQVAEELVYVNLDTVAANSRFADTVVNPPAGDTDSLAAAMVTVTATAGSVPVGTGTIGEPLDAAAIAALIAGLGLGADKRLSVELRTGATLVETRVVDLGAAAIASVTEAAVRLEGALRSSLPGTGADPVAGRVEFARASVNVTPTGALQITPGTGTDAAMRFRFDDEAGAATVATFLGIDAGIAAVTENVAAYQLGSTTQTFGQAVGTAGTRGTAADAAALVGSSATPRTGLHAFDDADDLNLLCIPRMSEATVSAAALALGDANFADAQVDVVLAAAIGYCEDRRSMLLVDPPTGATTQSAIRTWVDAHAAMRHRNVAIHFPRLVIADPLNEYRERSVGNSGTIAGLCARTDVARGVWKAPAGIEAQVRGIRRLETVLTDDENGVLNPIAINCLRNFDLYGNVNWGSRTAVGEDVRASEWKYVPVRRLALFLEETLFRGTKWVIHEPNDEPLWSQIRLSVGSFMNDLFKQGAFAGQKKSDAYFVRCDATTTTPLDRERGIVNLVVGFAPLRPAEFLIISIQQIPSNLEV